MLNISENRIVTSVRLEDFKSASLLRKSRFKGFSIFFVTAALMLFILAMFLPWTQNIEGKGYVTTRLPEQRPQSIQSIISGRLEKWYVQEGDLVQVGDTIVYLSEIKSEYFDPNLIERTSEQLAAKNQSIQSYEGKVNALKKQYIAIQASMELKISQTKNKVKQGRNKIKIDSIDLIAFQNNFLIAQNQLDRITELHNKGLKSLSESQEKELKLQEANAKVVSQQNKLLNQKNELNNLELELLAIERDYSDKLAKSQSDQQSALSQKLESIANTSKLKNQLSNYSVRQQFYYIIAPQSGYITKTLKKGIGEIIKEGADIATIMPTEYDLAVEIYIKPQDLPLISLGNEVRMRFDGWPAIVISGWPESSTGIFPGKVVVIDQIISDNGLYRLMISPNNEGKQWPEKLRVGTGANTFVLLKDVPLWYEIWRQLNGFPADYYNGDKQKKEVKRKAPIKFVK